MQHDRNRGKRIHGALLAVCAAVALCACGERKVDFSADVKPILNKRCISCHGGVKKNGGFSLLFRHEALDTTESGKPAIVPHDAAASEMIRRLTLTDPEERMPLKEEPLSPEEIEILTRWIDEGANWGDHWAYLPPAAPAVPDPPVLSGTLSSGENFLHNEVDHFVLQKLHDEGLKNSDPAPPEMMIRRVYLDLAGVPPAPEVVKRFAADPSDAAYEAVVDSLLASPMYGEKWASWWLDLARYADTKGYERDAGRVIWRYRDWVIRALNEDMPFDEFTVRQLAGDLLPSPTDDDFIATAFHRNTMNNDEGGTEDEEFRVAAMLDRVNTTWEVWQSTTMACVQCHSHPYDPFVHEDYYRAMAFFNNTRDEDTHGEHPRLRIYAPEDQKKLLAVKDWVMAEAGEGRAAEIERFLKTLEPKYHPHDFDQFRNGELIDTKWLGIRHNGSARLPGISLRKADYLLLHYLSAESGTTVEIYADRIGGPLVGRAVLERTEGWKRRTGRISLRRMEGRHDLFFVFRNPHRKPADPVVDVEWLAFREELPGAGKPAFRSVQQSVDDLLAAPVEGIPVMIESDEEQWRETFVFDRGNWLVPGAAVKPGTPEILNPFPKDVPANRLGFARWLVDEKNPLTARTVVNRVWEQVFGTGLVETLEDYGTQGATPSHPELLDWLAVELVEEYDWSVKKLLRKIVTSGTYRQSSANPESYRRDPSNRWLSRGARVRLSAEQLRDQALYAGGMLSRKMYGPAVMPYQPEGIWNSVWNGESWKMSEGEDQFRRSVYTYIKRTSPYPAALIFDGGSREVCLSRRIRTNTPLQALAAMNDSTYSIAARGLARRMETSSSHTVEQIRFGYNVLLCRMPDEQQVAVLKRLYDKALARYAADSVAARQLVAGREQADPARAALTVTALALLNLDETIMKE